MNIDNSSLAAQPTSLRRIGRFVRAALSHATGPLIAVAALLGSVRVMPILLSSWISGDSGQPLLALYRLVPSEIEAACMLVAVLLAEQGVRSGVRRLIAYAPAIVVASVWAGIISVPLIILMRDPTFPITSIHTLADMARIALFVAADALARGGLAAFIFSNRERWLISVRHLREAELQRARIEAELAKSHLAAMQATLQPAAIISKLEALDALYERDRCQGDYSLAEFIDLLRSLTASIHI
jgi:hypothetical protein